MPKKRKLHKIIYREKNEDGEEVIRIRLPKSLVNKKRRGNDSYT